MGRKRVQDVYMDTISDCRMTTLDSGAAVREFLEAERVVQLSWQAYSPDMNPREYVWGPQEKPSTTQRSFLKNLPDLADALSQKWHALLVDVISNHALVPARGGHIQY